MKFNTCSIVSNAYLFYVSFAGLGLGLGLVTAGLDYNTGANALPVRPPTTEHNRATVDIILGPAAAAADAAEVGRVRR